MLAETSFNNKNKIISYWLCLCAVMVLCMVAIGGATRLTGSGLSIVEWKPVVGALPPLNENEWNIEFYKYQQSPEFKYINNDMTLEGFKKIFWLEFIHRLAGRIVGLVFFLPFIFFWLRNYLDSQTKKTLIAISIIGLCQAFMGWYMVKSGLSGSPYVSHFRLTMHLLFALLLFSLLINNSLRLYNEGQYNLKINIIWKWCLGLVLAQIALGGLVAGLDAGLVYPNFPNMGEHFYPPELFEKNISEFLLDPAIVQFLHRTLAYILVLYIFYLSLKLNDQKYNLIATLLTLIIIIQFSLGIATLLTGVSITIALLHQLFAFILFALILIASRIAILK